MPHSGGGGSSGGGSHGGGGYGGDDSSYRVRNRYYSGARSFVYYRGGRPHYLYSDVDLSAQPNLGWKRFIPAVFLLPFIAVLVFVLWSSFQDPNKLEVQENYTISIEDNASVLDDTTALLAELTAFKEQTGITPAILTVTSDEWSSFSTLEDYAYHAYTTRWGDETHFLIVFSVLSKGGWRWETMIGDLTDPILTENRMEEFNDLLYQNGNSCSSVTEAFTKTFQEINPVIMTNSDSNSQRIMIGAILAVIIVIFVGIIVSGVRNSGIKNEELTEFSCEGGVPNTGRCHFCNGEYVMGTVVKCPHCGAKLSSDKFGF